MKSAKVDASVNLDYRVNVKKNIVGYNSALLMNAGDKMELYCASIR